MGFGILDLIPGFYDWQRKVIRENDLKDIESNMGKIGDLLGSSSGLKMGIPEQAHAQDVRAKQAEADAFMKEAEANSGYADIKETLKRITGGNADPFAMPQPQMQMPQATQNPMQPMQPSPSPVDPAGAMQTPVQPPSPEGKGVAYPPPFAPPSGSPSPVGGMPPQVMPQMPQMPQIPGMPQQQSGMPQAGRPSMNDIVMKWTKIAAIPQMADFANKSMQTELINNGYDVFNRNANKNTTEYSNYLKAVADPKNPFGGSFFDYQTKLRKSGVAQPTNEAAALDTMIPAKDTKTMRHPITLQPVPIGKTYRYAQEHGYQYMTENDINNFRKEQSGEEVLNKLEDLLFKPDPTTGKQGISVGITPDIASKFKAGATGIWNKFTQQDPRYDMYDSLANGALAPLVKSMGESGALAEGDVSRAEKLIASIFPFPDTEAVARGKMRQLRGIITKGRENRKLISKWIDQGFTEQVVSPDGRTAIWCKPGSDSCKSV